MTELVEHQKAKISELEAENENLLSLLEAERIMVEKLQRMLFGKKSEKKEIPVDPNQLTIGFEKLDILEEEKEQLNTVVEEIQIESHKRRVSKPKKQEDKSVIPSSIERRDIVLEPNGLDLSLYEKIGEDIREVLEYTPGSFYVNRYIRPKYKLKNDNALETQIHQADAHESFIPKSYAGDSVLAELVIGKYIDHLPIYRQVSMFKRDGINLPYSTLNSWVHQVATSLYTLYEALAKEVLKSDYIQVDETTLPVVKDEKKRAVKSYL